MSYSPRPWAGSDADVVDALHPHLWPHPRVMVEVLVDAVSRRVDPEIAYNFAQLGEVHPAGTASRRFAAEVVARFHRVVEWRRSLGDNVL